ncbi:MAG: hypothetical protein IJP78_07855 [Clostridia bacterium]|nr:hypothetical protein [Clostridia bacterium]
MALAQADMTLIYKGTDITKQVDIIECVCRDVSGSESDCLNLKVDHADQWFRWGPQKNDTIQVKRNGYDSKTLYLNTVIPEDGAYRILATGAKSVPFSARWQAFEKKTLTAIMGVCAGELGMGAKQFGVNGGITYEYLMRNNMSAPQFLEMLCNREGAVLKTLDGSYTAIGVQYAQGLSPMHEMELDDGQMDSVYIDRRDLSWASVQIKTPFGNGTARDSNAQGQSRVITDITVDNDGHAYRWAKGMLIMHNRKSEMLKIEMDFNPGYTAMVRIDVKSKTDAKGQWIIEEAEQDLVNGRTRAKLYRCITSVS